MLVVGYTTYVALIAGWFLRRRSAPAGAPAGCEWHFLVPCLNEQAVVEETVRDLVAQFPAAHVWCIDDASADATPAIVARLAAELARVRVVTRRLPEAQQGKGPALNAGWEAITGWLAPGSDTTRMIVGVVDADGRLDPGCLDAIAGPAYFGDPTVGAVQIKVRVVNRAPVAAGRRDHRNLGGLLVRLQDAEFTCVIAAQQTVRRHMAIGGLGGNGQFTRLSALNRVAEHHETPWQRALIEDFELGVHILLAGYRIEYCHDTWVEQEGLPGVRALVRQRCRWGQGTMQCLRYLPRVLRSRNISTLGALEIAYFLCMPWIIITGSVLFAISATAFVWNIASGAAGGVSPWLVLGVIPLVIWGPIYRATADRDVSRWQAFAFGVAHWPYTLIAIAAAWRALFRVIASRVDWAKTERLAPAAQRPAQSDAPRSVGAERPRVAVAEHAAGDV